MRWSGLQGDSSADMHPAPSWLAERGAHTAAPLHRQVIDIRATDLNATAIVVERRKKVRCGVPDPMHRLLPVQQTIGPQLCHTLSLLRLEVSMEQTGCPQNTLECGAAADGIAPCCV